LLGTLRTRYITLTAADSSILTKLIPRLNINPTKFSHSYIHTYITLKMPPTGATWTRITAASPPRSSHAIAHISGNTYVFSGEHHSRVAVANATLVLPSATTLVADASTPPARVGAAYAASDSTFYVHGGRGGASFSALNENGRVWTFNGAGWGHIDPVADGPVPPARSYHAAAVDPAGKKLFVHAGCADDGSRLGDLWCFDIEEKTWRRCADAPGDPRGAPALCVSGERVYRLGGFNGKTEVGGSVDVYVPSPSPRTPPA
jgi:N-acetylneuraminic acid mutarotase